jgi:hypothetical protein
MSLLELCRWIQDTALPSFVRDTPAAFPWLDCVHVIAATFVFGMIIIVDLRLLGLCSRSEPVSRMTDGIVPWIWAGFAVSVVTGSLMFSQTAVKYYGNLLFRTKMSLLLLAGLNMLVFHLITYRKVGLWDRRLPPPLAARMAGLVSLILWGAVIVAGRWIGFTLE